MRTFFANLSSTWKAVSAVVGFVALAVAIFSAGFGARGTVDEAVNVPGQLQEIQATQERGFSEVQDSIASVRAVVAEQGAVLVEHDQRLAMQERMDCSASAIEHHGIERRVDCRTVERLKEIFSAR